jgi:hypothetical protein
MVELINNHSTMIKSKIIILMLAGGLTTGGQFYQKHSHRKVTEMETNKISNKTVKAAIEAWQQGNSELWLSFFTNDAKLLDDGNIRSFKKFSTKAIGHERFISFDKVEDDGLSIYRQFHSDTWGDFKTYFKFHLNKDSQICQLEIGQAAY